MFPGERTEWHSSEVYAFREGEAPMRNWLGRTCDRLIQIGEDHGGPEACGIVAGEHAGCWTGKDGP